MGTTIHVCSHANAYEQVNYVDVGICVTLCVCVYACVCVCVFVMCQFGHVFMCLQKCWQVCVCLCV